MGISDWSSDVCSSDLLDALGPALGGLGSALPGLASQFSDKGAKDDAAAEFSDSPGEGKGDKPEEEFKDDQAPSEEEPPAEPAKDDGKAEPKTSSEDRRVGKESASTSRFWGCTD